MALSIFTPAIINANNEKINAMRINKSNIFLQIPSIFLTAFYLNKNLATMNNRKIIEYNQDALFPIFPRALFHV